LKPLSLRNYIAVAISVVLFFVLWAVVAGAANNPVTFPSPANTWSQFVRLFIDPTLRTQLAGGVETTLESILVGFALSVLVGVPIGFLMGRYLVVDLFLDPWVNSWYSIPAIAFVPLMMNWTGITWVSSMLTAFLVAVFSIIINVYTGVKNCNQTLVESAEAYGASQSQIMLKVIFPASLPNTMTGFRLGISRAIEGVIIAEMVFTVVGLGGMIDSSADKLQLALSYSLVFVLAIICLTLTEGMKIINRRVVAWKESQASIV